MSVSDIGDIYDKEEEEGVNIDNKYFNNFLLFFFVFILRFIYVTPFLFRAEGSSALLKATPILKLASL